MGKYNITNDQKTALIGRTIKSLGNNPTASGYNADQIRESLYQAIAGRDEFDTEINVVQLVNDLLDQIETELDKKDTIANVDAIKTALEKSISELDTKLEESISELDTKLTDADDVLSERIDEKVSYDEFSSESSRLQAQHTEIENKLKTEIANARDFAVDSIGKGDVIFMQNGVEIGRFNANTNKNVAVMFKNVGVDLSDYYSKDQTYSREEIDQENSHIIEIANGKTKTFVSLDEKFSDYQSQEGYDDASNIYTLATQDDLTDAEFGEIVIFNDVNGQPIKVKDLKTGDIVLIADRTVPDWWAYVEYSHIDTEYNYQVEGMVMFFKMETAKMNLDGYATEQYVDEHGGKIDQINVNGVPQPIENKVVDLQIQSGGNVDAVYLGNNLCPNVDKNVTIPAKEATTAPLIEPDEFPIVESISDQSTNNQIPTAKAAFDFAVASVGGLAEYVESDFVKTSNLKKDIPSTRTSTKISLDSSNVSKTSITGGTLGGVSFYVYSEKANGTNAILITGRFYIENYSRGGSGGTGVTITLPSDTILDNFANSETISRFMAFKTDNYKEGSAIVGVQPMYVNTIAGTKQISVLFQESFANTTSGTYQVYMPQTIIKV